MTRLLVIFGITGQQGSSVANKVLEDLKLSQVYTLRGITRDPTKPEAVTFKSRGVEIVQGDAEDRASVRAALTGAHTVFAMTVTQYRQGGSEAELSQGRIIADEVMATDVQYLIYSTVPSPTKLTSGKFSVCSFDVKDKVKDYIESLPIRSAFFAPGSFMQNYHDHLTPRPLLDGTLAITGFVAPQTEYPLIDISGDTGKFVGSILAEPDKYVGKVVCAATRLYTMMEIVNVMTRTTGKDIVYNQISKTEFARLLPLEIRDATINMHGYFEYCGYYGPQSKNLVWEAVTHALGKPIELEDYLKREPLKL